MKALRGGKPVKPNEKEIKLTKQQAIQQMKENVEKIRTLAAEGRYFEYNVPTACLKEALEWLKAVKGVTVIYSRPNKTKEGYTTIALESATKIDFDLMAMGSQLKDIEIRAMGLQAQKSIKKAEKDRSPISLTFPKPLGLAMWEETTDSEKDKLKFIGKHSSLNGDTIRLEFDIADCKGKEDLAMRIANIFEYADATRGHLRKKNEVEFIHGCIEKSGLFHPINQLAIKFERVTGKQLIEMGKANVLNSATKGVSLFQRILHWFSPKRNYTYYYMDRVISPNDELYVIEVDKPCEPKQADHAAEIWLRYDFGEQLYRGFGITLVEYYFNDMVALHNARQKEIETANANAATDNEG